MNSAVLYRFSGWIKDLWAITYLLIKGLAGNLLNQCRRIITRHAIAIM